MADRYVLDTSALLAAWQNEAGSSDVRNLFFQAGAGHCDLYISFMSFFEAYYVIKARIGEARALEIYHWLHRLPAERVNLQEDILIAAGDVKSKYRVSAIDAWIIATGLVRAATVLHKDGEFDGITDLPIRFLKIPRSS